MIDEQQLTDRFLSGMDVEELRVAVTNQPAEVIDPTRINCVWSVQPGDSKLETSDGTTETFGVAYLKINAPVGDYTENAKDVRDQFFALFRDWRSPDHKLMVERLSSRESPNPDGYTLICSVFWRSRRKF